MRRGLSCRNRSAPAAGGALPAGCRPGVGGRWSPAAPWAARLGVLRLPPPLYWPSVTASGHSCSSSGTPRDTAETAESRSSDGHRCCCRPSLPPLCRESQPASPAAACAAGAPALSAGSAGVAPSALPLTAAAPAVPAVPGMAAGELGAVGLPLLGSGGSGVASAGAAWAEEESEVRRRSLPSVCG